MIRALSGTLGAFFIVVSIVILLENQENTLMALNGMFLGLIFLVYGVSGKNVVTLIVQIFTGDKN